MKDTNMQHHGINEMMDDIEEDMFEGLHDTEIDETFEGLNELPPLSSTIELEDTYFICSQHYWNGLTDLRRAELIAEFPYLEEQFANK